MTKKIFTLLSLLTLTSLLACGGSSTSTGGAAMKEMNESLNKVSNLSPGGQVNTGKMNIRTAMDPGDEWSGTAELADPRQDGEANCQYVDPITPQEFIKIDFTPEAERCNGSDVNVFGRIRSSMSHICGILHALTAATSADLPTSGTETVEFTDSLVAEWLSDCGIDDLPDGFTSVDI